MGSCCKGTGTKDSAENKDAPEPQNINADKSQNQKDKSHANPEKPYINQADGSNVDKPKKNFKKITPMDAPPKDIKQLFDQNNELKEVTVYQEAPIGINTTSRIVNTRENEEISHNRNLTECEERGILLKKDENMDQQELY